MFCKIIVLPALGGATMSPLCPRPIGANTSIILVVKLSESVSRMIFSFGNMLEIALDASEKINATVVDMRFVKPLDEDLITKIANNSKTLISIEDNTLNGGAGSAINEYLQKKSIKTKLHILGVPDNVTEHGSQSELYELYGLTSDNIIKVSKK